MARRNNKKKARAHMKAMLEDEKRGIQKRSMKAKRKERRKLKQKAEVALCSMFTDVAVGKETKDAVPIIGKPVGKDEIKRLSDQNGDTIMKQLKVKRKSTSRRSKNNERRWKKIRERMPQRSAMSTD